MPERKPADPEYIISPQVLEARRFYCGFDAVDSGDLAVVCGGWERCAPDYLIQRETFPWLGLELVAGGHGRLTLGGRKWELRRGVVFTYGPGVSHRFENDPADVLSKYFITFAGREAVNLMTAVSLPPGMCRIAPDPEELEEVLMGMIHDGERDRPQGAAIAALQLRTLLLKLATSTPSDGDADWRARQTLQRCLTHLDQHYLEITNVEEIAAACHVSPAYLSRLFSRFGYGSAHRHLTRKKMLHAAVLLDSGGLLVGEVADRLGLDPFQFSRVFKRVHGLSPSDFIRRHGIAGKG